MPQFNIHEFERRPDWPLLVTAVWCRTCEAEPGALCCDMGVRKISGQIVTRPDFHAERKYDAVAAWHARGTPVTPVFSTPEETTPAEDPGTNLQAGVPVDVAAMVSDILDQPLVTPTTVDEGEYAGFLGGQTGGAGAGGDYGSDVTTNPETQGSASVPEPDPYTVSDAPDEPVQGDSNNVDLGGTDHA